MDMSRVNKLGGMPAGFPFAMVLIGAAAIATGAVLGGIREWFFTALAAGLGSLGEILVTAGAFLQGVRWVCQAFSKAGVDGDAPPT
jgi:hypothetical protein